MKRVLFIDRDGTILIEPKDNFQIDKLEKFQFLPGVISALKEIAQTLPYELVIVSNQDGLGTPSLPLEDFWPYQELMIKVLESEGVCFSKIHIDDSFEEQQSIRRKPRTGMLEEYFSSEYDLKNSYVIGDRLTDVLLAKNLGAQSIFIGDSPCPDASFSATSWNDITTYLRQGIRAAKVVRKTKETSIELGLSLDGTGESVISSGIGFLDHMLTLFSFHSKVDLTVQVNGDLFVDEHHSIEDTALCLGEAFKKALGEKKGISRYGNSFLPMDESLAEVVLDFSGRPYFIGDMTFSRDSVGKFPTELVEHFFESWCAAAGATLHMKVQGKNDHHKIEALFKGFGRAVRMAISCDPLAGGIPSTKGVL